MHDDYAVQIAAGSVWVIEDDGDVVGLAVLIEEPDNLLLHNVAVARPDKLLLHNVAVAPSRQHRGFGRRSSSHSPRKRPSVGAMARFASTRTSPWSRTSAYMRCSATRRLPGPISPASRGFSCASCSGIDVTNSSKRSDAMTKAFLGIIGGSGVYDVPGVEGAEWRKVAQSLGRTLGRDPRRPDRRDRRRLPAAPRARPPLLADRHQLPRQYRRAEAGRRHRPRLGLRRRIAAGGTAAGHLRAGRPVHRPHLRAREELLRRRLSSRMSRWRIRSARGSPTASRRPGAPRASPAGAAAPTSSWRGRSSPSLAESRALPLVGLRRDRHDQHAGGQARARGRDLLRDRRHGHRLRLLAPGARHVDVRLGHRSVLNDNRERVQRLLARLAPRFPAPSTSLARSAPTGRSTTRS